MHYSSIHPSTIRCPTARRSRKACSHTSLCAVPDYDKLKEEIHRIAATDSSGTATSLSPLPRLIAGKLDGQASKARSRFQASPSVVPLETDRLLDGTGAADPARGHSPTDANPSTSLDASAGVAGDAATAGADRGVAAVPGGPSSVFHHVHDGASLADRMPRSPSQQFVHTLVQEEVAKVEAFYVSKVAHLRDRFVRVEQHAEALTQHLAALCAGAPLSGQQGRLMRPKRLASDLEIGSGSFADVYGPLSPPASPGTPVSAASILQDSDRNDARYGLARLRNRPSYTDSMAGGGVGGGGVNAGAGAAAGVGAPGGVGASLGTIGAGLGKVGGSDTSPPDAKAAATSAAAAGAASASKSTSGKPPGLYGAGGGAGGGSSGSSGSGGGVGGGVGLGTGAGPGAHSSRRRHKKHAKDAGAAKLKLTHASLREAYTELYQTATLLSNFQIINYTGLLKIVRKHDKHMPRSPIDAAVAAMLSTLEFPAAMRLSTLLRDVEASFAQQFTEGSIHIAKAEMLVKRARRMDWGLIEIGMRLGIMIMLFVWFCWDVFVDASAHPTQDSFHLKATVPVFRALGALITLGWLWLFNVTVFHATRINYVYVLDCDVRKTMDRRDILRDMSMVTVVFLADFLLYFKTLRRDSFARIHPSYFPLFLFSFMMYKLVHPWKHRRNLWKSAWEVVTAPFAPLTFRHGFVADIFTSMVKVWADLAYTACFFLTGTCPVVLWWVRCVCVLSLWVLL